GTRTSYPFRGLVLRGRLRLYRCKLRRNGRLWPPANTLDPGRAVKTDASLFCSARANISRSLQQPVSPAPLQLQRFSSLALEQPVAEMSGSSRWNREYCERGDLAGIV